MSATVINEGLNSALVGGSAKLVNGVADLSGRRASHRVLNLHLTAEMVLYASPALSAAHSLRFVLQDECGTLTQDYNKCALFRL